MEHWLTHLDQSDYQVICIGELHEESTRNFWKRFQPGMRHLILFGALHCANEPHWLFEDLNGQAPLPLKNRMLNAWVLGEHQNRPLEAFVFFLDEIGIEKKNFVIPDTSALHPHIPIMQESLNFKYCYIMPVFSEVESMDAVAVFLANKLPSQQQINQSYFNFTYKPFKREDLTFDILVPTNNWRDTPPTVSPEALDQDTTTLIPLAQQLAPESETGEAKIQVFYTRMGLEIIANDLFGKQFNLTKVKNFSIPAKGELTALVDLTMKPFALGVQEQNFGTFFADVSSLLMVQRTPAKLLQAFKGFAEVPELSQISRQAPVLEKGSHIDKDGVLKVGGHYPTQPEATTFELAYIREQNDWKLLGINVAMKKMPQVDEQRSQKTNLLSTENGGQVVFCSNQYNQTSWGADNLIDGELGTNHGYASKNTEPAPTTAAVTLKWGNLWPMQHRSNAGRTT